MATGGLSVLNYAAFDSDRAVTTAAASGSAAFTSLSIDAAYPAQNAVNTDPSKFSRLRYQSGAGGPYEFYVEFSRTSNFVADMVAAIWLSATVGSLNSVRFQVVNLAGAILETTPSIPLASLIPDQIPVVYYQYPLIPVMLSQTRTINRLRIMFTVPANTSGYVDLGHAWAGPAVRFPEGVSNAWSLDFVDDSVVEWTRSGGEASLAYPPRKLISFGRSGVSYQEALGTAGDTASLTSGQTLRDYIRTAGLSGRVLLMSTDADTHKAQAMSVYGKFRQLPRIIDVGNWRYDISGGSVEEVR